jgi:hypothetical protein
MLLHSKLPPRPPAQGYDSFGRPLRCQKRPLIHPASTPEPYRDSSLAAHIRTRPERAAGASAMNITTVGIDLAKLFFQVQGLMHEARSHCENS